MQHKVYSRFGRKERELVVVTGQIYLVDPLNVQKMKHRGRLCEVIAVPDGMNASVRFIDNGRRGKVEIADLALPPKDGARAPAKAAPRRAGEFRGLACPVFVEEYLANGHKYGGLAGEVRAHLQECAVCARAYERMEEEIREYEEDDKPGFRG